MLPLSHTSRAVADAITHYRRLRELTVDELSYALSALGHDLDSDDLRAIEEGKSIVTVDDLVALAVALDVTPVVLLSHIPVEHPGEGPLATGVPEDVDQPELRAWMEGRTSLDRGSRLNWSRDRVSRLRILSAHHEDQLQGAHAELRGLGELALQEADALPVIQLHDRIRASEREMQQADLALAYAEMRLEQLQGIDR